MVMQSESMSPKNLIRNDSSGLAIFNHDRLMEYCQGESCVSALCEACCDRHEIEIIDNANDK